ncbi:MAG: (Fe-S)-binding protein [bacterium]
MKFTRELLPHAASAALEIEKCTSCGLCKEVCPVFALTQREAESPRGKINLLKSLLEEAIDPSPEAVDIFNRCLLCYACQDACPAGVQTERIWIPAREILADEVGRPLVKSFMLRQVLGNPRWWRFAMGVGKRFPGGRDTVKLGSFSLPRPAMDRIDRLLPEIIEPHRPFIGTVAYFPGCLLSEVFPYLGLQAAEILITLGYRVVTPADRVCCGAPAFNNGDMTTARKLAERNLEIFTALNVDAVLSPDATCGGAFTHEYDLLFPAGSLWRKTFVEFSEKVQNYGEFILNAINHRGMVSLNPINSRVTIHDSCHLSHLQHKAEVPRKLLSLIPGLKIVENPRSDLCCGFGGSYSVQFPNESKAITRRKLEYIGLVDGNIVVVGSPGCLWKMRSEAVQLGLNLRFVHYAELLWESLCKGQESINSQIQPDAAFSAK